MRTPAALVVAAALVAGACQTRRGALIGGLASTAAATGCFAVTYSARNDDEGPPIIFPLGVLVFGAIAIGSFLEAAVISDDDPKKPATP
jgi:hypothetical protein